MNMKKGYKIALIVILIMALIGVGIVGYFFFFYEKPVAETPVNEVQITNTIEQYGYT